MFTLHLNISNNVKKTSFQKNSVKANEICEFTVNDLLKRYNLDIVKCNSKIIIISSNSLFQHFSLYDNSLKNKQEKNEYYFNKELIIQIVGNNEVKIEGLIIEFLAYAFFDKEVRSVVKKENIKLAEINENLFMYKEDTKREDCLLLKQSKLF